MNSFDDVLRHFGFFAQLQCLLEVGESVLMLALFGINASDIVQADGLQALIADIRWICSDSL